jgi:hypothetical protein
METVRIRDGKKSDSESGINIPDPPHWLVASCKVILPFFIPNDNADNSDTWQNAKVRKVLRRLCR